MRLLDFPHAAGSLAQVAPAGCGAGTAAAMAWLDAPCHALKPDSAAGVLGAVRAVRAAIAGRATAPPRRTPVAPWPLAVVATSRA